MKNVLPYENTSDKPRFGADRDNREQRLIWIAYLPIALLILFMVVVVTLSLF